MTFHEIIKAIKKNWVVFFTLIIIGALAGYWWASPREKKYVISTLLTIQAKTEKTSDFQYNGYYALQASEMFSNTMMNWINDPNFLKESKNNTGEYSLYARRIAPQNIIISLTAEEKYIGLMPDMMSSIIKSLEKRLEDINAKSGSADYIIFAPKATISQIVTHKKTGVASGIAIGVFISLIWALKSKKKK